MPTASRVHSCSNRGPSKPVRAAPTRCSRRSGVPARPVRRRARPTPPPTPSPGGRAASPPTASTTGASSRARPTGPTGCARRGSRARHPLSKCLGAFWPNHSPAMGPNVTNRPRTRRRVCRRTCGGGRSARTRSGRPPRRRNAHSPGRRSRVRPGFSPRSAGGSSLTTCCFTPPSSRPRTCGPPSTPSRGPSSTTKP